MVLTHVLVTLHARDPVPFVVLIHAWHGITENCGIEDGIWHNMGFKQLPGLPFKHGGPETLTIYLQTWCSYSLSEGEFLILPGSFFFFFFAWKLYGFSKQWAWPSLLCCCVVCAVMPPDNDVFREKRIMFIVYDSMIVYVGYEETSWRWAESLFILVKVDYPSCFSF